MGSEHAWNMQFALPHLQKSNHPSSQMTLFITSTQSVSQDISRSHRIRRHHSRLSLTEAGNLIKSTLCYRNMAAIAKVLHATVAVLAVASLHQQTLAEHTWQPLVCQILALSILLVSLLPVSNQLFSILQCLVSSETSTLHWRSKLRKTWGQ